MNGTSPQGPRGHFLVGSSPEFLKDSLGFVEQLAHDYGDIVKCRSIWATVSSTATANSGNSSAS
jgi:hypothetical protein